MKMKCVDCREMLWGYLSRLFLSDRVVNFGVVIATTPLIECMTGVVTVFGVRVSTKVVLNGGPGKLDSSRSFHTYLIPRRGELPDFR